MYFFNIILRKVFYFLFYQIINNYNNNFKKYGSKLYYLYMNQINKTFYVLACISAELCMFSNIGFKIFLLCQLYCNNNDINCNVIAPDLH